MAEIYSLLHHLKSCPEVFFLNQQEYKEEAPQSEVLIKDIYRSIHGNFNISDFWLPPLPDLKRLQLNHLIAIQVGCWFFSFPYFRNRPFMVSKVHQFFFEDLEIVSLLVKPREWIEDEDRAEEFIRLALKRCEIILEGETHVQAADRLSALDSVKRQEILRESNEAMERIREIRRKMAEEKAREAANVYGRE